MVKKLISFSVSPRNDTDINGIIHQIPSIQVDVYASSIHPGYNNETRGPQYVVNYTSSTSWSSNYDLNQWIVINFTTKELFATHYAVQSIGPGSTDDGHAKQWKVDGFKFDKWIQIDDVEESKINGRLFIETRKISNTGPFSAFRFTSTGVNWIGTDNLRFLNIDFFGIFLGDSYEKCSIQMNFFCANIIFIGILISQQ